MKTNIHFRFASYVLAVTLFVAVLIFWSNRDFIGFVGPLFIFLIPKAREFLGPSFKGWHERDRDVSTRTLVIGFFICLVIVWVGGITVAHYISPEQKSWGVVFPWILAGILWLLLIYPAYQWWRTQKIEAGA